MATHTTFRENALRIIAVLGLIAILLLGAWGIIQLAYKLPTFFSNWGKARETLTISVPSKTTSDSAATVSWKHAGAPGEFGYSLSYSCAEGLQFAAPVPTGAYNLVPCNTPFNYVTATSSMPVIPVLAPGTTRATTTITVAAMRLEDGVVTMRASAGTTVSASTTAAVVAPAQAPKPTKPTTSTKPSTTYVPSGRTQNLYGLGDLAVQITQAPVQAQVGSRITMQFVVTNMGTNVVPAGWTFNAVLPYNPIYVYPSGGQQALYPGDKIVYTLGYDVVPASGYGFDYYSFESNNWGGQAQATIEVDPMNAVSEASEYNNTAVSSYQVY